MWGDRCVDSDRLTGVRIWGTHGTAVDVAPPGRDRWATTRVLAPFHALVAMVLTWPLAAHLTGSLPYGTEPVPTVGRFNLWTLRWNQDRAGDLFAGYWDAPIFHPTARTFALSEPQPLTGLVFTPLSWVTGNPVLAANLVLLAILAANGWAAARLVRRLGVAPVPAVLAGVLAQAMPFVATQMGVLQLTVVFPLFLLLDALVLWASAGGRRVAAGMGLWLAVTFLTCGYYGLFAVVGIGAPALLLARATWVTRARLVDLAVAAGVFAVLALPIVVAQSRVTDDYPRPDALVEALSATASDFWQLDPAAHGAGVLPWVGDDASGQTLYPGTALLALGLVGFALAYRGLAGGDDQRRRLLLFLPVGAALGRALALGLNFSIGPWQPYRTLRAVVPGFASLRSPFRFAVLTEVFLVALAALGLDALWRWRPAGRRPWGAVAAVVVVAAGVVEAGIMPVDLFPVDQATPDWAAWLDDHSDEAAAGDGAVAFLPFPPDNGVASYADTADRMLQSLDVGVVTVNGYSGLFPADYEELEIAMRAYPNEAADALLRDLGVSYLVVDAGWLVADRDREPWLLFRYSQVFEGRDTIVYEVP